VDPIERHGRAVAGFTAVVERVPAERWDRPTPCAEWDARAVVEHVIGFHEFLLLRPLGVRAHRPRSGPEARWLATEAAIRGVLAEPERLADDAEYFDGVRRPPAEVLAALAADTLIHTWDLARAVGAPARLDPELCALSYRELAGSGAPGDRSDLFGPAVAVPSRADVEDRLLGLTGRDPGWRGAPSPKGAAR
jgi:uncharacterized protein (TIGR03086 family)